MTTAAIDKVNGTPVTSDREPRFDPLALAEAEAIRIRAEGEANALRIEAEGKAKAEEIRAAEEARKQKLANDRAQERAREEQAAREARIAEHKRKQAAAERAERDEAEAAERQKQAVESAAEEVAAADDRWRSYALGFYRVCAIVALPVQVAAFYDPSAIWLMAAPLMLEGGAWVVLKGAAAAVANRRPSWHYRLIAWLLAFIAAGVNLYHGLAAFDPATAIGTAFASIAGPGVWDLHEHGRIRKRDGVPSRRERRAAEKKERRIAAEKAAEEKRRNEEKEAADKAAEEEAKQLAALRENDFPNVWKHARHLATDLGKLTVTEAIWKQAKLDVEGAPPGESAEIFRMRNVAKARVESARTGARANTHSKTMNAQRAIQVKAPRKTSSYKPVPPRRRRGDSPKFHPAAKALAADAKRAANASGHPQGGEA